MYLRQRHGPLTDFLSSLCVNRPNLCRQANLAVPEGTTKRSMSGIGVDELDKGGEARTWGKGVGQSRDKVY